MPSQVEGLAVPGLDLGGAGRDVDVEGEPGGRQQPDCADDAGVGALVGEEAAVSQGVGGVVERAEGVGVGGVLDGAAALAEAARERARSGGGVVAGR